MTNYLLSIDPSITNTGITLWENKKPILVTSYSFKKFNNDEWKEFKHAIYRDHFWETNLIIERGTFNSKNGIGYETQEHLRGFIAGQFNKLLTKNMLISPSEWQNWYLKYDKYAYGMAFANGVSNKKENYWDKNNSLIIGNRLIKDNNWNIKVNNHDEADSLLIGWYYLNKENK
ncbi:hypothetical protein [Spiroplasma endosymbiont of Polydrusus pterygomalis]|uniref:hypothetical protein n=1 Tax=Spiroplasma endosymbiont of Polydrusus pterygomalis TaxID=3139327 RepID=UPI003CCAB4D9